MARGENGVGKRGETLEIKGKNEKKSKNEKKLKKIEKS